MTPSISNHAWFAARCEPIAVVFASVWVRSSDFPVCIEIIAAATAGVFTESAGSNVRSDSWE